MRLRWAVAMVALAAACIGPTKPYKTPVTSGPPDCGAVQHDNCGGMRSPRGGILKMSGFERDLDPASGDAAAWGVLRLVTRQLMAVPAASADDATPAPVPDIARAAPQVTADRLTYTFQLRPDVMFGPPASRPVRAVDIVRGLKRLCLSELHSPGAQLFEDRILGFGQVCRSLRALRPPRARDRSKLIESFDSYAVPGLVAVDDTTLVIRLLHPVDDLLKVLALPYASPFPFEAMYIPAGGRRLPVAAASSGPYSVTSFRSAESVTIRRNPHQPLGDPLREAFVDGVDIETTATSAKQVFHQIDGGAANLPFGLAIATDGPKVHVGPSLCEQVLVFNTRPHGPKVMKNSGMVPALSSLMDHAAVSAALGGLRLAPGIGVPSPPEHAASVAGVTLHFRGRQRIAQSLRPSLLRAGVKLVWLPNPKDYFQPLKLQDWDIAAVVRCPSWLGDSDGGVTRDLPATPLVRLPDATMASSRVLDVRFVAGFGVDLAHLRLKE